VRHGLVAANLVKFEETTHVVNEHSVQVLDVSRVRIDTGIDEFGHCGNFFFRSVGRNGGNNLRNSRSDFLLA
jgi:hypothetical protein